MAVIPVGIQTVEIHMFKGETSANRGALLFVYSNGSPFREML